MTNSQPSLKILYIEDDLGFRENLERRLLKAGYQIMLAANARSGLEMAQLWRPDAIILDIWMADLDGLVLAAQLHADPTLANVPMLALTILVSDTLRGRALAAGCVGYLNKLPPGLDPLPAIEPYLHGQRDELTDAERVRYMDENTIELVAVLQQRVKLADQRLIDLQAAQQNLVRAERLSTAGRLGLALAHQLNNPLQAIQTALELLSDEGTSETNRHLSLALALQEMQRTTQIINMLLDDPRTGANQVMTIDVSDLVEAVLMLLHPKISAAQIQLQKTLKHGDYTIQAVYTSVHQILFNLILNAIEVMPDGGKLSIGVQIDAEWTLIQVTDSGPGVDPMARLFEPFYTSKRHGHGLGLYVCELLARAIGSRLGWHNNAGGGATFTLSLPFTHTAESIG